MAARRIPKSNIPNPHEINPLGVRELTREEIAERREQRRRGERVDESAELLPDDAGRIRKRHNVTLDTEVARIAKRIGRGVLSRGLEHCVRAYERAPGRPKKSKRNLT